MTFGERFSRALKERGLTQLEAAKRCKVSRPAIARYCSMTKDPRPATGKWLSECLDIPLEELSPDHAPGQPRRGGSRQTVRETAASYTGAPPFTTHMRKIKRRWPRMEAREKAQITLTLQALFGEDADEILAWLNSE